MTAPALITGIAGQDGIYLARRLRSEGKPVVGTVMPGSDVRAVTAAYLSDVTVIEHDLRDVYGFVRLVEEHAPNEVYNLAAFSSVGASWQNPDLAVEVNGSAVLRLLEALPGDHGVRFFQASSSEILGDASESPYAQGKAMAHQGVLDARERGLFACSATLYNHESPLRAPHFVTRKITRAVAEISLGRRKTLALGNLAVFRDWGHARDYVDAMVLMLRQEEPADFAIASGVAHSLQELLVTAFAAAGLDDPWRFVEQDPELVRPSDTNLMVGDPTRITEALGWSPSSSFEQTVTEMVRVDLHRLRSGVEEDRAYLEP